MGSEINREFFKGSKINEIKTYIRGTETETSEKYLQQITQALEKFAIKLIDIGLIEDAASILKDLPQPEGTIVIKKIIKSYMYIDKLNYAECLTHCLPEKERIPIANEIFEKYIKEGKLKDAEDIASLLPKEFSIPMLQKVAEKYIEKNKLNEAEDLAISLPTDQAAPLLKKIAEIYDANGDSKNSQRIKNIIK